MSHKLDTTMDGLRVSITAPRARRVHIAGDFNRWDRTANPLRRGPGGRWVGVLELPPGPHEYKFIVDGCWCCEDGGDSVYDGRAGHVPNAFGTMNIAVLVPEPQGGCSEWFADC